MLGYFQIIVLRLINALQVCMVIRALLSWFPGRGNIVNQIVTTLTEPLIIPIRALLDRFEFVRRSPIDLSFFATFLLLYFLQSLVSGI